MTFLELQNLCAYWLDDLQFGYFTQTQVKVWLNNAQQEVQKRLIKAGANYYTKCVTASTVTNQRKYAFPADLKKINRLEVIVQGTVPNESFVQILPITLNQVDLIIPGPGQPAYYYIDRESFMLWPTPDRVYTLRMVYSYQVTNMILDSDTPDVPAPYHELIALLATQDGFLKDGRSNDLLMKKLKEYDEMLYADSTDRNQDAVRMVVSSGDDFNGGLYW